MILGKKTSDSSWVIECLQSNSAEVAFKCFPELFWTLAPASRCNNGHGMWTPTPALEVAPKSAWINSGAKWNFKRPNPMILCPGDKRRRFRPDNRQISRVNRGRRFFLSLLQKAIPTVAPSRLDYIDAANTSNISGIILSRIADE